jgi:hypothetical protein
VDILGRLVSLQSLFALLWFVGWVADAEYIRLLDEGHPPEYASIEYAAYVAVAGTPFWMRPTLQCRTRDGHHHHLDSSDRPVR